MSTLHFQDCYPDDFAICYGCGRLNAHGYQLKSFWDAEETVCRFKPKPYHTGAQNFVYGGLVASLIDCHGTATAAAAKHRFNGKKLGEEPLERFVTASLHVDYLQPVPIDKTIEVRGTVEAIKERKVTVAMRLLSDGRLCARGSVIAVRIPDDYLETYARTKQASDSEP